MNKQEFLNQLREAFIKYEIPESKSQKYFKKFEKLIDEVEEKDQEAKIQEFGSPDEIAKKFKEVIEEKKEKDKAKKQVSTEKEVPTDQEIVEKNEVVSVRGKYFFIGGLVLTSPIWITVSAFVLAVLAILCCAMIVVDIAIAVVMTAAIIVGGILSASSIIYGVIALLPGAVASYIGMYELGLGLIILGALIVSGILLHFFVVKVTPIVFKSSIKLVKFLVKKLIHFIKFVRKECDKI